MSYVFPPAPAPSVPVVGTEAQFPLHRIYCVGRNYEEHAKEMGFSGREPPFFFMKPGDAVVGGTGEVAVAYPPATANLHHEVELVVALGLKGGAELLQVELQQFFVQQFGLHSLLDELREVVGITRSQSLARDLLAQHLACHGLQQQARGDIGVVRIQFDLGACGEDGSLVHFGQRSRERSASRARASVLVAAAGAGVSVAGAAGLAAGAAVVPVVAAAPWFCRILSSGR